MRFHQSTHILLLGFTLIGELSAAKQRQERIFGSPSGSSVIVVYKKDHDKDNAADRSLGGRGGGGGGGGGGLGSGGQEDEGGGGADFRSRDQRDPRDHDGRQVDIELRKEHGIKIFPNDNERDIRAHDHSREPFADDHHGTSQPHKSRSRGDAGVSATFHHNRKDDRRSASGVGDDRRDFDDGGGSSSSSSSSADDDYRFTKAKDSFSPVRGPSSFVPAADVRPACARELDLCSYNHDYPLEKVQSIVDRYYNQMYDLYHAMYKIPPHEVQWVENFTHSFSQEKQHGQFVCRSEISYLRVGWAKNYKGHWMTVVNTERFPQMTRVEKCRYRDKPCDFMAPCFKTSCKQREMLLPLIAVSPHDPSQKPQVDLFPIPSGCVCYVDDPFFHSRSRKDEFADHGGRHSKLPTFLR